MSPLSDAPLPGVYTLFQAINEDHCQEGRFGMVLWLDTQIGASVLEVYTLNWHRGMLGEGLRLVFLANIHFKCNSNEVKLLPWNLQESGLRFSTPTHPLLPAPPLIYSAKGLTRNEIFCREKSIFHSYKLHIPVAFKNKLTFSTRDLQLERQLWPHITVLRHKTRGLFLNGDRGSMDRRRVTIA